MFELFMIWIALLLFVGVGTFLSTLLRALYRKGDQARGNRLNTLDRMLYQQ